jgi:hypothetical protein
MSHLGSCFCDAVKLEVSRDTGGHGLLSLCFLSFVVRRACKRLQPLEPEAVRITSGAEHVATFQKTEFGQHQYCAKCGGHLMTDHPPFGLVDVFAATLPTLKFTRGVHVVYTRQLRPDSFADARRRFPS